MTETAADLATAALQPGRFDADTAVRPVPGGAFEARIDPRWSVGRGPNGGYLTAIVLRALTAAVADAERTPRSVTLHFVAPAEQGAAIEIHPSVERTGGLLTSLSVRVLQDGRLILLGLAAFSRSRAAGPEFSELQMPAVPEPEAVDPLSYAPSVMVPVASCWEHRYVRGIPFSGADRAEITAWARLPERRGWDALSIAALADGVIPAITPRLRPEPVAFPTVDLTVHLRSPVPAEVSGEDYLLAHFRTRLATGGFFEEDGEVWSPDGRLLAQSRQLMVVLPRRP